LAHSDHRTDDDVGFHCDFLRLGDSPAAIFAAEILKVGAGGLGLLAAAPGAGSIISGLVMARFGVMRRQGKAVLISVAIFGAATVVFGLSRWFWLSLLMLGITGASDTVSTVLRQTIRQLVTPDYFVDA